MQFHWELLQGGAPYPTYLGRVGTVVVLHANADPRRLIELPTGRQGLDYDSHIERASTKVDQYRSMAMAYSMISSNLRAHSEHSGEYGM